MQPPKFDEKKFLENLLLDEHREAYARMDKSQRTLVRFAFASGWLKAKAPPPPEVPKCAGCGTIENLHRDYGSGGPYRCDSPDCMVF